MGWFRVQQSWGGTWSGLSVSGLVCPQKTDVSEWKQRSFRGCCNTQMRRDGGPGVPEEAETSTLILDLFGAHLVASLDSLDVV